MTESNNHQAESPFSLAPWVNYRRKRFWLLVLFLLYTLVGFFGVPALLNKWVVNTVRQDLGREASFEKIHFNPFALRLTAEGFELKDTDDEILAGFDRFLVDFEVSSLFRWAWTFKEISLDGFDLLYERYEVDDSRLSRLLDDFRAGRPAPPAPSSKNEDGLPRLLIMNLNFREGSAHFKDHVPETTVMLDLGPVNISVQGLDTLPDRFGQQAVTVRLPGDATLEWQGSIDLAPLKSEGKLAIRNSHLDQAIAYLEAVMPLDAISATLDMNTNYRLNALPDGRIDAELDELQINLNGISFSGLAPRTQFLSVSSLGLSGGKLRFPENTLEFEAATIKNPEILAALNEDRQFSLLQLAPQSSSSAPAGPEMASSGSPWHVEIGQLSLENGRLDFEDQSISPPGLIALSGLQFTASNISNEQGRTVPVNITGRVEQGGGFELSGEAIALPSFTFEGTAGISDIPLTIAQPYIQQYASLLIGDGLLSSQLELNRSADKAFKLGGSIAVAGLLVSDTRSDEKLLGWSQFDIDRFEWAVDRKNIELSLLSFEQPYGRFRVNKDRTTNLSGLAVASPGDAEPSGDQPGSGIDLIIGGIGVKDGELDFSDLSLPLQFATKISDLDGSISTIDTSSSEPANIRLEGQVDEFGLARIEGTMSVFDPIGHSDVSVEFRNLMMSSLSPYSAEFAGREIDEGKLDLDLEYAIEQGQLQADNKLVLGDLVLGAKVENPDAASLPLDLAVALLKDSEGVIKLDLPITGDVNNPEFEIGPVVMQAIVTLVTRIVSAPFRLLGNLIGIDSEDLGRFQFLAGRSDLTPPELEKIGQLQQALQQRPELSVEISGPFDPASDTPKLQYFRLRDEVLTRLGKELSEEGEEIEMLDDEIRSILEELFTERFPGIPLQSLKAEHTTESAGLDELSYSGDLRDRLLANENITTADLEALGNARADSIRQAFLADGDFDESRVLLAAPVEVESEDSEWVATELGVAGK